MLFAHLVERPFDMIRQVDWAEEQASRTDEFQRELQVKTEAISDLNGEKVTIFISYFGGSSTANGNHGSDSEYALAFSKYGYARMYHLLSRPRFSPDGAIHKS